MPTDKGARGDEGHERPSIGELRRRIDEIDRSLAELLQSRAQLTAAVQQEKLVRGTRTVRDSDTSGARPARDPDRERQIAESMARHAPGLGVERLARIMDVVIAESIAASPEGLRGSDSRVT